MSLTNFVPNGGFEEIWPLIRQRAAEADVLIHTGFFKRGVNHEKWLEYHRRIASLDVPAIFVTNSPYKLIVPEQAGTVLVTFSVFNRSLDAAAAAICGERGPTAKLGFDPGISTIQ